MAPNKNVHHNIQNFTDYLNKPSNIDFTFEPTSENNIYNIINNLKNKKSMGKDEICNKFLKSIKHIISKPLSIIINKSLVTGIFPNAFVSEMVTNKLSKITRILNKLKFIYPQNILLAIYNSLSVSHINYGSYKSNFQNAEKGYMNHNA